MSDSSLSLQENMLLQLVDCITQKLGLMLSIHSIQYNGIHFLPSIIKFVAFVIEHRDKNSPETNL